MKFRKIALFQIILLLLMAVTIPSFALTNNLPTLSLNKTSVTIGTNVTASGVAEPGAWVPLKIVNNEKNIVVFDVTKADENGAYSISFVVPPNASGILTVVVGEGKQVATGSVTIKSGDSGDPGGSGGDGGGDKDPKPDPIGTDTGSEKTEPDAEGIIDPDDKVVIEIPMDITGHWAEADIKILIEKGAITGYPDQTFKPDNNITRAEFASVLVKAFELETKTGKIFDDTAEHWAKDVIATANAYDIIKGYSDEMFGPDDTITREQMALMIVRATELNQVEMEIPFTDSAGISDWAKEGVAIAVKNGFINGYPDNTFRPQGNATRAEATTVIIRALQVK